MAGVNKNYITIGVSVRTTKFAARNNGIGVRQERSPQSATNHSANVIGKRKEPQDKRSFRRLANEK
jgi:hypothetical protein